VAAEVTKGKLGDCTGPGPAALAGIKAGDVVVSMLPAPMHPEVARVCLDAGCHLVTTSYISDAMRALDGEPPRPWMPQPRTLALLSTGDGATIASWGPFAAT
jgi:hypothetical protein